MVSFERLPLGISETWPHNKSKMKKVTPTVQYRISREARVFDADLARLFRNLPETKNIAINCALYIQYLDRAIRMYGPQISNEVLRKKYLDFFSKKEIRTSYEYLKNLGIIVTNSQKSAGKTISKEINVKALVALAELEMVEVHGNK